MKIFSLQIPVFSILMITVLSLPPSLATPFETVVVDKLPCYRKMGLPSVIGPESLAFDADNGGPYTGVSDGRILKYNRGAHGWMDFAIPPRRRGVRREECEGTSNVTMEDKCGRPLGLQFHNATGDLYIADAYYGLLRVGKTGGVATKLATAAEGVAFGFTNGVDVDQRTGMVYFTDSSTKFHRMDWILLFATHDASGRFMSYNPKTKEVKVLIRNLEFPNGVSLSKDGRFALICESVKRRILRYWLRGPKARNVEVFVNLTESPDNIKMSPDGEFWVALNSGRGAIHKVGAEGEELVRSHQEEDVIGMKFGEGGGVLEVLDHSDIMNSVSEVMENKGTLWLGSVVAPFVANVNVNCQFVRHP